MVYILIGFWTGETDEDWIYRSYSHIIWSQNRWRAGPAAAPGELRPARWRRLARHSTIVIVIEGGRQTTPVSRPSLPEPLNQRIATAVGQWHLDFCRARTRE